MLYLGCHLSTTKGYENMIKEAISIGANTFAFFTRNPRGGKAKAIDERDIEKFLKLYEEHKFGKLVAHAPYTLNPCSANEKVREFAYQAMVEDLERMEYIKGNYYNFHPGSHTGLGSDVAIDMIADLLNKVMREDQHTTVLLETMAGKGSEVGRNFEEISQIIEKVNLKHKIGVCLDTCHVSDGGYDIKTDLDGVLHEFDEKIGLDYLKALHVNDSKNTLGARKDRHAKIGEGYLEVGTFEQIVNNEHLKKLPMILETPNELDGYKQEIELLRKLEK